MKTIEIVNLNGTDYNIDVARAKQLGVMVVKPVEVFYRVGNLFKDASGNYSLLARIRKDSVCLIPVSCYDRGNRWRNERLFCRLPVYRCFS